MVLYKGILFVYDYRVLSSMLYYRECERLSALIYTQNPANEIYNLCNLKQNQSQDYSTGKWPNEMLPTFAEKALLSKKCTRILEHFLKHFFYFSSSFLFLETLLFFDSLYFWTHASLDNAS
jgi:hypothetical protein